MYRDRRAPQQPYPYPYPSNPSRYARPIIPQQRVYAPVEDKPLISEVVPVPSELAEWVLGSKVQSMFLKVKEASGIGYITSAVGEDGRASIIIRAASESSAKVARMLVEINFKEQIKYQMEMQRLHMMQENLFEVQGEVASGQRIEFTVPSELIGLIIGKKGSRIQEVEEETGVTDIHIDGETGRVTIIGPSPMAVQKARELMDVAEENYNLDPSVVPHLQRDYSSLNDVKSMSKCLVVKLNPMDGLVTLIGPRNAIAAAKLVLDTQLEYISKRVQLYESEKAIREQLTTLNKGHGRRGGGFGDDRQRRGGSGGGSLAEHARPAESKREPKRDKQEDRDAAVAGGRRQQGTESLQTLGGEKAKSAGTSNQPAKSSQDARLIGKGQIQQTQSQNQLAHSQQSQSQGKRENVKEKEEVPVAASAPQPQPKKEETKTSSRSKQQQQQIAVAAPTKEAVAMIVQGTTESSTSKSSSNRKSNKKGGSAENTVEAVTEQLAQVNMSGSGRNVVGTAKQEAAPSNDKPPEPPATSGKKQKEKKPQQPAVSASDSSKTLVAVTPPPPPAAPGATSAPSENMSGTGKKSNQKKKSHSQQPAASETETATATAIAQEVPVTKKVKYQSKKSESVPAASSASSPSVPVDTPATAPLPKREKAQQKKGDPVAAPGGTEGGDAVNKKGPSLRDARQKQQLTQAQKEN